MTTHYREADGHLAPEKTKDAVNQAQKSPGPTSFVITQASLMDTIAAADAKGAPPETKQRAIEQLQIYIAIATPSDAQSRELRYFRNELKRLQK